MSSSFQQLQTVLPNHLACHCLLSQKRKEIVGKVVKTLWGRREDGSGWGTHVYLWRIHFDIWQNQYSSVKFKNKIK